MKRAMLLQKGLKFQTAGSGLFAKDLLRDGTFVHPATGQVLTFTPERRAKLALETNRYLEAGNKIPYPAGHSLNPLDNMGDWPGPFLSYGDRLIGFVEPKDQVALQKMRDGAMDCVSVCIEFDRTDSKGNHYPEVITHVAATDYPVITGQVAFMELSSRSGWSETYVPAELAAEANRNPTAGAAGTHSRSTSMDLSKLAVALGLAADTPQDKINEAMEAKLKAGGLDGATQLSVLQKKLAEQLATHGPGLESDKVVRLATEPMTAREKEQASQIAELQLAQTKVQLSAAKSKAEALVKSGKVPAHMLPKVQQVLSVVGNFEALSLSSANPKEILRSGIDLSASIGEIFEAIPSLTQSHLQQLSAVDAAAVDKKKQEMSARTAEAVKRAQPELAAKK